jgi:hypothetical protein
MTVAECLRKDLLDALGYIEPVPDPDVLWHSEWDEEWEKLFWAHWEASIFGFGVEPVLDDAVWFVGYWVSRTHGTARGALLLMRNRTIQGAFRYGLMSGLWKRDTDSGSIYNKIEKRWTLYKQTQDPELLLDCANFARCEWTRRRQLKEGVNDDVDLL